MGYALWKWTTSGSQIYWTSSADRRKSSLSLPTVLIYGPKYSVLSSRQTVEYQSILELLPFDHSILQVQDLSINNKSPIASMMEHFPSFSRLHFRVDPCLDWLQHPHWIPWNHLRILNHTLNVRNNMFSSHQGRLDLPCSLSIKSKALLFQGFKLVYLKEWSFKYYYRYSI